MIEIGDVFLLRCTLCNPPKPKFFVAVQVRPLRMLLINSEINAFLLSKPRHLALHIPLQQCDHSAFLVHDSYLACDQLSHEYSYERLSELLEKDPSVRKGRVHDSVHSSIGAAFKGNHLIPVKYLRELIPLWAEWVEPAE